MHSQPLNQLFNAGLTGWVQHSALAYKGLPLFARVARVGWVYLSFSLFLFLFLKKVNKKSKKGWQPCQPWQYFTL